MITVAVTFLVVEPPAPVQIKVKVVVIVRLVIVWEPEVVLLPDHWLLEGVELAKQEVVLAEDQVKATEPPEETWVGLTERVRVGLGGGATLVQFDILALIV